MPPAALLGGTGSPGANLGLRIARRPARPLSADAAPPAAASLRDELSRLAAAEEGGSCDGDAPGAAPEFLVLDDGVVGEALCKGVAAALDEGESRSLMVRRQAERTVELAREGRCVVLSGQRGTGKSCTAAIAVQKLRADGWTVLFVPSAADLTERAPYVQPNPFTDGAFDAPWIGATFLSDLLRSHSELLDSVAMPADLAGRYRRENCPPRLVDEVREYLRSLGDAAAMKEATKLDTLGDCARVGLAVEGLAAQAMTDVLEVLLARRGAPADARLCVCVDEYNALFYGTEYSFIEQQERVVDAWDVLASRTEDAKDAVEGEDACWPGWSAAEAADYASHGADWRAYLAAEEERRRREREASEGSVGADASKSGAAAVVTGTSWGGLPEVFGKPWEKAILELDCADFPQLRPLHFLSPSIHGPAGAGDGLARGSGVAFIASMTTRVPHKTQWLGRQKDLGRAEWERLVAPRLRERMAAEGLERAPGERALLRAMWRDFVEGRAPAADGFAGELYGEENSPFLEPGLRDLLRRSGVAFAEVPHENYDAGEAMAAVASYVDEGLLDGDLRVDEVKFLEMISQRNPRIMRESLPLLQREHPDAEDADAFKAPY